MPAGNDERVWYGAGSGIVATLSLTVIFLINYFAGILSWSPDPLTNFFPLAIAYILVVAFSVLYERLLLIPDALDSISVVMDWIGPYLGLLTYGIIVTLLNAGVVSRMMSDFFAPSLFLNVPYIFYLLVVPLIVSFVVWTVLIAIVHLYEFYR